MKIALINENSQASKNNIILTSLNKIATKYGHKVYNYGMNDNNDANLTYVQAGLLAAILINSGAVDFVVTGCGTGEGAMLACNSFPKVLCGLIVDPTDAILFAKVNNGNAIALPYAKGFGWGAELTLDNIFDNLFSSEFGSGYPKERVEPEQANKKILDNIKSITHKDMLTILKEIDKDFLLNTINHKAFKENFFENAKDNEIKEYIKNILC